MGIFDKAKNALNNEQITDSGLDKAEELAKGRIGEDKAEQITGVRDQLDERVGEGNPQPEPEQEQPNPEQPNPEQQ